MSQPSVLSLVKDTGIETPCRGSEAVSQGVRVRVTPIFEPDHSDPYERRYIFSYSIRITNERDDAVQLLSRRWTIINAHGDCHDVQGDGVVGRQPILQPGAAFEYQSYCPLTTPWGTMEGAYGFVLNPSPTQGDALGQSGPHDFEATIDRFYLVAPEDA
ncbi:MAG: Co2+/Mg2+ efflux protein ApaG [Planctomycetota bacterium]